MKIVHIVGILIAFLWPWRSAVGQTADTIYTGGDIVTVNDAQPTVEALAELGIVPSFFTAHTFYWGDWHINETVGKARAYGMSPTGYALQKGLRFTNHSDAPVVPPDPLMIMWTAVNRLSRSGIVVGPDERISPLEALKATTIHAARQYFEEKDKGSLEPGKIADLVILDRNPLKSAPDTISQIRVLHTIKDGKIVYSATDN